MVPEEGKNLLMRLFKNHYTLFKCTAFCIVKDDDTAEDLVQDAFEKLIRYTGKLQKLDEHSQVAYCVQAVQNICFSYFRKKKSRMKKMEKLCKAADCCPEIVSPIEIAEKNFEKASVRLMLTELDERDRKLLVCKYFMEYDNKQIGKIMNIKTKQVSTYILRARERALRLIQTYDSERGAIK